MATQLTMTRPSAVALLAGALAVAGCATLTLERSLGTPAADAVAPAPPLDRAWRIDAEGAFGPDAPAVTADGRVVVGTRQGQVVVIEGRTGKRFGKGEFGESVEGRVAFDGDLIVAPLARSRRGLVGYDVRRSARLWSLDEGPHMASPTLVGQTVVALSHDGTVRGLDLRSGAVRWAERPDTTAQYRATPLAADGGLVITADTKGTVRGIDPSSGTRLWTVLAGAPVYRTPAVGGGVAVVPTTRGRLVGVEADAGRILWAVEADPEVRFATPVIAGDVALVGATDRLVRALDLRTGAERWATRLGGVVTTAPLVADGAVFVGAGDKSLTALDLATGEPVWSTELSGRVKSGLTSAGGSLIVLAEPRHIYGFRPAQP